MKQKLNFIFVLFLGSAFLFSSCYKTLIRLEYEINKLDIIEKFCINKEQTTFECEGKCHLNSMLKEVDKSTKDDGPRKTSNEHQVQLFYTDEKNVLPKGNERLQHHLSKYLNLYSFLTNFKIDPPPKMI